MAVGKAIGNKLDYGFAGSFAVHPEQIVATRPSIDDDEIIFGSLLVYDDDGNVKVPKESFTMDKFAGVAARIVKQSNNYTNQNFGSYLKGEAVSVFQKGIISVECVLGTPKLNSAVYYIYSTEGISGKIGFSAEEDTGHSIKLEGIKFAGDSDSNNITSINILNKINV